MFEKLVCNLTPAPKFRYETLEGKQYLVVPGVMITEGVHEGSNGPLYYPEPELAKTPVVWNHKPVISYHPTDANGNSISACDPAIIESRGVGLIMNTTWDASNPDLKKLRFEAWIDEQKLAKVDSRVLDAIKRGEVVEISTGLFTDNENVKGEWKGKTYTAIARNYRPDHLAILYDKKGACSVRDGAGLLANEATMTENREFTVKERKRLARKGHAMKDGSYPITTEKDLHNAVRAIGRAKNPASAKKHIIARAKAMGKTDAIPATWNLSTNGAGQFAHIHDQLHTLLSAKHGKVGERWNGYIEDVAPSQVIYGNEGELFSHAYSVNGDDYVTLTGDPKKMKRISGYFPADYRNIGSTDGIGDGYGTTGLIHEGEQVFFNQGSNMGQQTTTTNQTPTREERVNKLMTENGIKEGHRKRLMEMDEASFQSFEEMLAEAEPTSAAMKKLMATGGGTPIPGQTSPDVPGFNQGQGQTLEQYIGAAPPAIRELLVNAMAHLEAEKNALITNILADPRNGFTKEWLMVQNLGMLKGIAALANGPAQTQNQQGQQTPQMLRANYLGATGALPVQNQQTQVQQGEGLKTPTINWKD